MTQFTRAANYSQVMKLSSVLKFHEHSVRFIRTLTQSPFSISTKAAESFQCLASRKVYFSPPTKQHRLFSSSTGMYSYGSFQRTFLCRGKQLRCCVKLFHTNQIKAAKLPTGIRGSPSKNNSAFFYVVSIFILMVGGAYAGVPLYKVFCQATGLGGQAVKEQDTEKIESMKKVDREIRVRFNADVASSMRWNFKPQQSEVTVLPGETALAFYTARNPTDKPIIGISTYNVLPFDAGQYFNKIQCFCFEEQRLNPKEQVDMPVFFYIDPEFALDPKLEHIDTIHLSYTFFEAVDGLSLPLPGYPQPHDPLPQAQ